MILRLTLICVLILFGSIGSGFAKTGQPTTTKTRNVGKAEPSVSNKEAAELQFELVGNLIVLHLSINGSRPLPFLLDTGAEVSLMTPECIKALGLSVQKAHIDPRDDSSEVYNYVKGISVNFAGVIVADPITVGMSLGSLDSKIGHRVSGIISASLLKGFIIEIDYSNQRVRLYDPKKYQYVGNGKSFPIQVESGTPLMNAEVQQSGSEPVVARFLVDTGTGSSIYFDKPFAEAHSFLKPSKSMRSVGVGVDGKTKELVGRIKEVRIGQFVLANPLARFSQDTEGEQADSDYAGTLGGELLRRFTVIIDYTQNRIILEPNRQLGDPDDTAMSGMGITTEGDDYHTFVVSSVFADSPAQESGIMPGDIISAIDGKPAASFTLEQMSQMFKQEGRIYTLRILRGKEYLETKVKLRRLI